MHLYFVMTIHIVDSVKGGSGKSTFALKLALSINQKNEIIPSSSKKTDDNLDYVKTDDNLDYVKTDDNLDSKNNDENSCKSIIIDLDFMGTSWLPTYKNALISKHGMPYDMIYVNDLVFDWNHYRSMDFTQSIKINNTEIIKVIVCSDNPRYKEKFKVDGTNKSPSIQYDIFQNRVMKLISNLEEQGYTDIILDMPPNSEPYSDTILRQCLQDSKYYVNLYMVSSTDIAHIKSTHAWYYQFLYSYDSMNSITLTENPHYDKSNKPGELYFSLWYKTCKRKIFFVLNDIYGFFNKDTRTDSNESVNLICDLAEKPYKGILKSLGYIIVFNDDIFLDWKKRAFSGKTNLDRVEISKIELDKVIYTYEDYKKR